MALFALEKGDYDFALDVYDNRILAANTEFFLDVQNGASLLKRLELLGSMSAIAGSPWRSTRATGSTIMCWLLPICTA